MFKKKKIGLALSGGGPKGVAHIGVIKKLQEYNIPIDFIAGTSMGAFIGGWYAAKKDIEEIENVVLTNNWPQILRLFSDVSLPHALVGGTRIETLLEKYLGKTIFDELQIPFTAMATDLNTGQPVAINSGSLTSAIRASISIPMIFKPYHHDGKLLVDGALCCPIPILQVNEMGADVIIAVNIYDSYFCDSNRSPRFFDIFNNSVDILCHQLAKSQLPYADILISPDCNGVGWGNLFTTTETQKVIKAGEEATDKRVTDLKNLQKPSDPFSYIASLFKAN